MQQIRVYADSLSWGIVPTTRQRLDFDRRWPGVMEHALIGRQRRVRVIEDCLNGRHTVWEYPFKPGRNGLTGLAQRIDHFITAHNVSCRPFKWTATADSIAGNLHRLCSRMNGTGH